MKAFFILCVISIVVMVCGLILGRIVRCIKEDGARRDVRWIADAMKNCGGFGFVFFSGMLLLCIF